MEKIILKLDKNNFSYIKYILFTYFKIRKMYEKNIRENVFFIPFKKTLKSAYIKALTRFLKEKNIKEIYTSDQEIKDVFKNSFSVIIGKNIYRAIFCDILNFITKNKLYEYEIIFISDNLKEVIYLAEKCVKSVKNISILTQKPFLYESMRDYFFKKYGIIVNIRVKKEKLKKHNKIYVNCGANKVFGKSEFKNVDILDIYNVYEGAYCNIILEAKGKAKEYTKLLKCPYDAGLAEFLEEKRSDKNYKIVNIKK